jgi:hypothetical protein
VTYFVLDGSVAERFGQSLLEKIPGPAYTHSEREAFPSAEPNPTAFQLIEYSQLASREEFPAGRYVFLGLGSSCPSRIRLAAAYEARLRDSGSEVWNPPSALAGCATRLEIARCFTPRFEIDSAIAGHPELPCVLRASDAASLLESPPLESIAEHDALLLDWVLEGTEPELIFRIPAPERGHALETYLALGGRWFEDSGTEVAMKCRLSVDVAEVCGWEEGGQFRVWRVDDRAGALLSHAKAMRRLLGR